MRNVFAFLMLMTNALPLAAQSRELDWPSVTVTAHLDADGRLQVQERQVMRFTGNWNGGERIFNLRRGQDLAFTSMARLDTALGTAHAMNYGDLDSVDGYKFTDSYTLRWRSRKPSDPVFDHTVLTYLLTYAYANFLVPQDDGSYLLDHDFGFPDRDGTIERFTVVLTLDSAWHSATPLQTEYSGTNLAPGASFTITLPLTYAGSGPPAAVLRATAPAVRYTLIVVFLASLGWLLLALAKRERQLGRFAPLTPAGEITPAWLEQHVFTHLPEVAGAAWDDRTSAPEVAATLARLVQEKKLSSEVEVVKRFFGKKDVLHLTLNVDRSQFQEHERALVNALFRSKETTTSTDKVRERYRSSGFDPALLIRSRLEKMVERTTPGKKGVKPSRRPTLLLLAAAIAFLIAGMFHRPFDILTVIASVGLSIPLYLFALGFALAWRQRVTHFAVVGTLMLLPLAALTVYLCWYLLANGYQRAGALALTGIALWYLGLANSILNAARSRQSAERIVLRKQLTAARNYFRAQLNEREPQLKDAWFPYLIAFGLGSHIDKWFKAFGGVNEHVGSAIATSTAIGSSSDHGGGGSGFTGFGGGGGFSGGGGGASFAAAVGGMAASVPSPSSSGSSSGGGGSSSSGSSGGGGGGGW